MVLVRHVPIFYKAYHVDTIIALQIETIIHNINESVDNLLVAGWSTCGWLPNEGLLAKRAWSVNERLTKANPFKGGSRAYCLTEIIFLVVYTGK